MAPQPPLLHQKAPHLRTPSKPPHKSSHAPTKRLKRQSKHATLLSRISKTAPGSKVRKTRRPSKKLVTNLGDLADALPDTPASTSFKSGNKEGDGRIWGEDVKIKYKSLKSRAGAGKKKERLVAMERERFARNMAQMAGGSGTSNGTERGEMGEVSGGVVMEGGRSRERWAAIRGFISQTIERRSDGVGERA